jgi:hypothetical protein
MWVNVRLTETENIWVNYMRSNTLWVNVKITETKYLGKLHEM